MYPGLVRHHRGDRPLRSLVVDARCTYFCARMQIRYLPTRRGLSGRESNLRASAQNDAGAFACHVNELQRVGGAEGRTRTGTPEGVRT